jgi:hypothetical protein
MIPSGEAIRKPCRKYDAMADRWAPVDDLCGGTVAMRAAREKWLPAEEKETPREYESRLARSFLFGAFSESVDTLTAKPFARAVTYRGALSPLLSGIESNADRAGTSFHDVVRESFVHSIKYGKSHLLVDPAIRGPDETRESFMRLRKYPAIVPISPVDLIYWRHKKNEAGELVVSEIRILECVENSEGEEEERVRVIVAGENGSPAEWAIFAPPEGGGKTDAWRVEDSGLTSYSAIPIVTWYSKRVGPFVAWPPQEQLAWLNVSHWQISSDHRNILRFAAIAQQYATGVTEEDAKKLGVAGWNRFLHSTAADAKFGVVEHTGKAIEAISTAIRDLETRMEILGMRPAIEKASDVTATAAANSAGGQMTRLQSWIRSCEIASTAALVMAHEMVSEKIDPTLKVDVFSDFRATTAGRDDLPALLEARRNGDIPQLVFLDEMQRRGVLKEDADVVEIVRATEAEKEASIEKLMAGAPPIAGGRQATPPASIG